MPRRDNRRPGKPAVDRDHASSRPQSALDSAAPCSLHQEPKFASCPIADLRLSAHLDRILSFVTLPEADALRRDLDSQREVS